VVGAGPTGVELAGALGEIGLHTLAHDFRTIDPTQVRVLLFEAGDRVLAAYPPKLSEAARRSLERRHVEVRTDTRVTGIDDRGVTVAAGGAAERIGARTVLWAAGVEASPLGGQLDAPRDRAGRVAVSPDLSVPGHPEVFVIGDLARMESGGAQVPGVAQGAIQGGRHAAKIIASEVRGRPSRPAFRYRDKGNMATIGRAEAVIATKRFAKHGLLAWLLWWAVHIMFLVGYRNRVSVMLQWAWSWLTFKRGARLITGPVGELPPVRAIRPDGQPALPEVAQIVSLEPDPRAARGAPDRPG
jgi:NADH:ubiquinone reductase (H+-translocating)